MGIHHPPSQREWEGGGYNVSPPVVIESEPEHPFHVIGPGPDIVAAILAHCIRHIFLFPVWYAHGYVTGPTLLQRPRQERLVCGGQDLRPEALTLQHEKKRRSSILT